MTNSLQLTTSLGLTLGAGLMMAIAGTRKQMLHWKAVRERCPACGRRDRSRCPCRR